MLSDTVAPEALLIPDAVACALAGLSRASWWRLHAAAKTPRPVKLGRRVLWRRAELVEWVQAGCPDRLSWEAMQAQGRRRTNA